MARVVKELENAARRNDILDAAERLVYTQGFDEMSIQDILDQLQMSKGAFYHYFASKQALLQAMIDRSQREVILLLTPIVQDPTQPALQKLDHFFNAITGWKNARKAMLLALMRILYSDANALVREKQRLLGKQTLIPLLDQIIEQGQREGVIKIGCAEPVGSVVLSLLIALGDTLSEILLSDRQAEGECQHIEATVSVYIYAVEQVLGLAPNVLHLVDREMLWEWFEMGRAAREAVVLGEC